VSAVLEPGTVVDGVRVEARIHSGGMADIYRVSGPDLGFPLLMKVPRLGPTEPASAVVSFEVERMVHAALKGKHVPRFVAAGDVTRRPHLVMELVEGKSLAEWVERAPLPPDEVARLGAAIATALDSVHLQEAIHLDLKPGNVIIRPDGDAVLVDFGLAHHAHYPDLLAEEFRHPMGSAPYIAPEQVMGDRSDPRSDLFALGVVLYQLATGVLPFGAPASVGGLRKRVTHEPEPPRALVPSLPEWLQEVILHCLEPDPAARYASAAQVAFDLTHPEQVPVGARGARTHRAGGLLKRWFKAAGREMGAGARPAPGASILVAAVATGHTNEALFQAQREAVKQLMEAGGHTRVACVTAIRPSAELGGSAPDETATSQRIKHLVLLRHWAEPLQLEGARISFHVLESADPAGAIVEYARTNHVDHIVIGAPPSDLPLKAIVGTVATKVATAAPCTVTLVRPRAAG
jgi:nucleotide-binding universal stress UspA family protein